jgi:hypothetical protein
MISATLAQAAPAIAAGAASDSIAAIRRAPLRGTIPRLRENVGEPGRWIGVGTMAAPCPPASEPANVLLPADGDAANCPIGGGVEAVISNCKRLDLRFQWNSSLGGEFGERIDSVKDASCPRAGGAGARTACLAPALLFCAMDAPFALAYKLGQRRARCLVDRRPPIPGAKCSKKSSSRTVARSPAG